MNISPRVRKAAEAAVDRLMRDLRGIKSVVIATEDGFEVAGHMEGQAQLARMSALASSLSALGALAGEEGHVGICEALTIEAAHGQLLMVRARHDEVDLIVCIVASRDAVIGQVLYTAKQVARTLRQA